VKNLRHPVAEAVAFIAFAIAAIYIMTIVGGYSW
jgi:hypothetical protein